ncbi:MAG: SAM-dependent methyltransferase [Streptosporangiaceae bacterium]
MAGDDSSRQGRRRGTPGQSPASGIDTSTAHMARVYDYWLGGENNFPADRDAARQAMRDFPGIVRGVQAQRGFLTRVVRYLAADVGVRQFLDIGTGLPTASNTHEVAQAAAPECRIVYADNDPLVLAHARALLASSAEGATDYLDADLRDTAIILEQAARTLDFGRPVAVLLIGILQLIPDEDQPHEIVARLMSEVPAGSWLAIAHPTQDLQTSQIAKMAAGLSRRSTTPTTLRTHEAVTRFFDGLDLTDPPGVLQLDRWAPAAVAPGSGEDIPAYCGLARKPGPPWLTVVREPW